MNNPGMGWLTKNGMMLSFILAVVATVLFAPVSIILWLVTLVICVLVLRTIRRNRLPANDSVAAWMVVIFSCLALFILGLFANPLFRPRTNIHREYCSNNLHQLGLAIGSYTSEHEDRYPDPDKWPQQLLPYVISGSLFKCPKVEFGTLRKYPVRYKGWDGSLVTAYAMNERLRGLSVKDVRKPEETVLLFESNGEKLAGGPELLPKETRHDETRYLVLHDPYINVLFADWHVNKVPLDEVRSLKWDPK